MSDDDNYSWLDKYSTDPAAGATGASSAPPPMPPSMPPAQPGSASTPPPIGAPGALPPMSRQRGSRDHDPLAEQLKSQPLQKHDRRKNGRGPISMGSKLKIGGIVLAVIALVIYANFIGPDTSSIGGLDVGECFEAPDGTRVKRVTMQDCALPHEGQVVAEANGLRDDSEQKCSEAFASLDPTRIAALPRDASFAVLNATISHRCVVISPSGQLTMSLTGP